MKKYPIIYADPPWLYSNPQDNDPRRGGKTYDQMRLADIKALPVQSIAAKDSALFMWATMPKLVEALEVMAAWGFRYTTVAFTWLKLNKGRDLIKIPHLPGLPDSKPIDWILRGGPRSGQGYWTNGNQEIVLFGKRGKPKRVAKDVKQVIIAPITVHSEKPPETRDRIVKLMGDLPRIELFARHTVPGWDCWGNEAINVDPTILV